MVIHLPQGVSKQDMQRYKDSLAYAIAGKKPPDRPTNCRGRALLTVALFSLCVRTTRPWQTQRVLHDVAHGRVHAQSGLHGYRHFHLQNGRWCDFFGVGDHRDPYRRPQRAGTRDCSRDTRSVPFFTTGRCGGGSCSSHRWSDCGSRSNVGGGSVGSRARRRW